MFKALYRQLKSLCQIKNLYDPDVYYLRKKILGLVRKGGDRKEVVKLLVTMQSKIDNSVFVHMHPEVLDYVFTR